MLAVTAGPGPRRACAARLTCHALTAVLAMSAVNAVT
jgi:hypothetical protein